MLAMGLTLAGARLASLANLSVSPAVLGNTDAGMSAPRISGVTNGETNPGLPTVVTTTDDSGPGSLRQAILNANTAPGLPTITFAIPGTGAHTINLLSPLPGILNPVVIDGATQPGFAGQPVIELNGSGAGPSAYGLDIGAGSSTVRGLVINRFSLGGIRLYGNGGNTIQGNYVGTGLYGTNAPGNTGAGLSVDHCANNQIGGTVAGAGNLLSGNGFGSAGNADGIVLSGTGSFNNTVRGNLIGTDVTGTRALPNARAGIVLWHAPNNTIGGNDANSRNVISGNAQSGIIAVEIETSGNFIQGNFVGTDGAGGQRLANGGAGIYLANGARNNRLGGSVAGAGNLLSGNAGDGVFIGNGTANNTVAGNLIGTSASGLAALGNSVNGVEIADGAANTLVGGTAAGARNIISGNTTSGVAVEGAGTGATLIQGNFIGTDATGLAALPNGLDGVTIDNSAVYNLVGGPTAAARNVISGNRGSGISIAQSNTVGNVVAANYIGLAANGTTTLSNQDSGISIFEGASANVIGGTGAGTRNVISGNGSHGVYLASAGTAGNLIQGNFLGTDCTGAGRAGNRGAGVYLEAAASANTVGGTSVTARNIISGNNWHGVVLTGGAFSNTVAGNFIGTDVTGSVALGNASQGVHLNAGASGNTIGGATTGAGNLISGNALRGVAAWDPGTANNLIAGNRIGTDASGTRALGNGLHGVSLAKGVTGTTIGGVTAGARNVLSGNAGLGAIISSSSNNFILGNYIGTDLRGESPLGNQGGGVVFQVDATLNQLGGAAAGARNIIAGNGAEGFSVVQAAGNAAQGNFIGVNAATNALGNYGSGVYVSLGTNILIGGTNAGEGNFIAFNQAGLASAGDGVTIESGLANAILGNSICSNAALGIALGTNGLVLNDRGGSTGTDPDGNTSGFSASVPAGASGAPPTITGQPQTVAAAQGDRASLSVIASGSAPLAYQWRHNGTNLPGATASVFSVAAARSTDAGNYVVTVASTYGSVTSSAAGLRVVGEISATLAANRLTLQWPPPYVPQSATDVVGPYYDLPGAISPLVVSPAERQLFFRLRATTAGWLQPDTASAQTRFRFNVNGLDGYNYAVLVSTNLATWVPLVTNPAPFVFVDPNSGHYPQRFYRTVLVP
jgi:hypothetical protein